jgi:beta-galactosidase beta subunit
MNTSYFIINTLLFVPMKKMLFATLVLIATTTTTTLFAQTTSVKNNVDLNMSNLFSDKDKAEDNWAMYSDDENHKYYIDFQKISVNLNDIHVKNEKGEEVFKDNLFTLPVDTIYELDLSKFPVGKYEIELRTFTQSLKRTVAVK